MCNLPTLPVTREIAFWAWHRCGDVGGGCRGVCFRGIVQGARTQVFELLQDPGPELSSCDFHALGSDYGSLSAAGTLWLPLKRLTLFSILL